MLDAVNPLGIVVSGAGQSDEALLRVSCPRQLQPDVRPRLAGEPLGFAFSPVAERSREELLARQLAREEGGDTPRPGAGRSVVLRFFAGIAVTEQDEDQQRLRARARQRQARDSFPDP